MFKLVETATSDKLLLHGLFLDGDKDKPVVLHIHGFEGDFFTNNFVPTIAEKLRTGGFGFLAVQTRGLGSDYFVKTTNWEWKRYGAHYELLEEAHLDIDAWVGFLLAQGYKNIILQGHSLGTMKITRYLFEGKYADKINKLILLAPFDIFQLAENATKGKWKEYLKIAEEKVTEGKGEEIIPKEYLDASMSYQTYVSHHKNTDFEHIFAFHDKDYGFPILRKIKLPVKAIVGTGDVFFHPANPKKPDEAMAILEKHLEKFDGKLIEGAGHSYEGYEDKVANEVSAFVTKN